MTETATFVCSICNEPSTEICVYCTKDACKNHRCERCKRCSDCCECEVPLTGPEPEHLPDPEAAAPAATETPDLYEPPVAAFEPPPAAATEEPAPTSPPPPAGPAS